jgi:hypothetical protein
MAPHSALRTGGARRAVYALRPDGNPLLRSCAVGLVLHGFWVTEHGIVELDAQST